MTRTSARQRSDGVVLQGRFDLSPRISIDGGARGDYWRVSNLAAPDLQHNLGFFQPRVGVSFRIDDDKTLRVAWLTGFRVPTMNEL